MPRGMGAQPARGARVQHPQKLLDRLSGKHALHGVVTGEPLQRTGVKAAHQTARVVFKGGGIEWVVQLVQAVEVQRAHAGKVKGPAVTQPPPLPRPIQPTCSSQRIRSSGL
ncbi:LOW QUALITY PROTEIN: hypothetical protein IFM46972_10645 [Aspergillus udagawae]|uniref:Uncharacterized protein n=1 Tax=Aspergillus udagawae TaxID=91492 RepID=A0A8H3SD16_9EURO|nr:LOW QUALITY PROTEIN: hypothetical protein IFM46972_10645 [Aspergillus udagawae]